VSRLHLALAGAALAVEGLWPALWPAAAILTVFLIAALFDLLPLLPGALHLAALVALALAFGVLAARALMRFRRPGRVEARRRIERASGLAHRPLALLDDRLLAGRDDPAAEALWQAYRRRRRRELGRLVSGWPRAGLALRDPHALRAALGLLLIVAIVAAGGDAGERLARALTPAIGEGAATASLRLEVWVTPPGHTGVPPLYLGDQAVPPEAGAAPGSEARALVVPEGSAVLAQAQGAEGRFHLVVGETVTPFEALAADSHRVEGRILSGDRLAIRRNGEEIAHWPLAVTPDRAPTISFLGTPDATERGALRMMFEAEDDYALRSATAILHLADGAAEDDEPLRLPLALLGGDPRRARNASYHDLTAHPWAGLRVELYPEAVDALGQTGAGESVRIVLPERQFTHPVARAIIAQRKLLTQAPERRAEVAAALAEIAADPAAYDDDLVVALGLRIAGRRLLGDPAETGAAEVRDLLWDLALRLEDGGLSLVERELRRLQEELQRALAGDAPEAEIERLMQALEEALDRYLQALVEQMQRELEANGEPLELDEDAIALQREDLQELIERAREMARLGARDAARQLLAQLQEILENLQARPFAGMPPRGQSEAVRMLRDLDSLMQGQMDLLDETFRQSQQTQPGDKLADAVANALSQEALRRQLGNLMRRLGEMLGEIPQPFGRAERAMRESVDALREGDPRGAVEPQGRVIDELQQGSQALAEAMAEQLGGPYSGMPGQDRRGSGADPLGRNALGQGVMDTSDVAIPNAADLQRAREILDELRQRAGERSRPRHEREYIERLLEPF
jgi:uncharacterized protein (TIGR02302 family)